VSRVMTTTLAAQAAGDSPARARAATTRKRAAAGDPDDAAAGRATVDRILDAAERLVQTRGFNAFSYANIAAELHVTKSSLHYHFASKVDLGVDLIARYESRFLAALQAILAATSDPAERLRRYMAIYEDVLREDRMCLCGMLATEFATLDVPMRGALQHFFDSNDEWLVAVLEAGRAQGALRFSGPALSVARMLVSSLEGAMLLARFRGDAADFESVARRLLDDLVVSAAS